MSQFEEEAWEAQIGSMLAGLPDIEPPAGFIDSALDHRPLYAGRVLTGLVAVSVLAVVASVASGVVGHSQITPEVDDLAAKHTSAVQAGVLGSPQIELGIQIETSVDMPAGFQRKKNLAVEDLLQAVYERGDESVSVFVQEGSVQWDAMEIDGLAEIDGLTVWVDVARMMTIVEASDNVVTIVGLQPDQVAEVLESVPRDGTSVWQRAQNAINALTGQLGYPDLD